MTEPERISNKRNNLLSICEKTKVVKMAIIMPIMPKILPLNAVFGDDSIRIETMSINDEIRYAVFEINIIIFSCRV